MSDLPFGQPARLGQLLQNVVRKKGLAEESNRQKLDDAWRKAAGQRVAARSHVRRLQGGILEIGVTNGAILEELTCYLQHELLPAVQQLHADPPINSLKFIRLH
ncbi:MAG: DUF721 domain-containing protein [Fuerstiella sp.]